MALIRLPSELLLSVADRLPSQRDISHFARTNRALFGLLNPYLYRYNVLHDNASALLWAASTGSLPTLTLLFHEGAQFPPAPPAQKHLHPANPNTHPSHNHAPPKSRPLVHLPSDLKSTPKQLIPTATPALTASTIVLVPEHPIVLAALHGHAAITQALLDHGAPPDWTDARGQTPLMIAADKGHIAVVRTLLFNGADATRPDIDEATPVTVSALRGHLGVVITLLKELERRHGCDVASAARNRAIGYAAFGGHVELVRWLLDQGVDVDTDGENASASTCCGVGVGVARMSRTYTHTPLLQAVRRGDEKLIRLLLERGADPLYIPWEGNKSPLVIAVGYCSEEVAGMLLDSTRCGQLGVEGEKAMYAAILKNSERLVRRLLKRGVDPGARDFCLRRPLLSWAVDLGCAGIVRELLARGARVDERDEAGCLPVDYAAKRGYVHLVEVLEMHG